MGKGTGKRKTKKSSDHSSGVLWQYSENQQTTVSLAFLEKNTFEDIGLNPEWGRRAESDWKRDKKVIVKGDQRWEKKSGTECSFSEFAAFTGLKQPLLKFAYYYNHQNGFAYYTSKATVDNENLLSKGFALDKEQSCERKQTIRVDENGLAEYCDEEYTIKSLCYTGDDQQELKNSLAECGIQSTDYQIKTVNVPKGGTKLLVEPCNSENILTVKTTTKISYDEKKEFIKLELVDSTIEGHSRLADIMLPNRKPNVRPIQSFREMVTNICKSIFEIIKIKCTYSELMKNKLPKADTSTADATEELQKSLFTLPKKRCFSPDLTSTEIVDAKRSKKTAVGDYITNSLKINR